MGKNPNHRAAANLILSMCCTVAHYFGSRNSLVTGLISFHTLCLKFGSRGHCDQFGGHTNREV